MPAAPPRTLADLVRGQKLVTALADDSVAAVCARMRERGIGAVLVVDVIGALQGIFTERDAVFRVLVERRDPDATVVGAVMTAAPATLPPAASALEALRLMDDGGYRHVPVVESGRIFGVVSRRDFRAHELARLEDEISLAERAR